MKVHPSKPVSLLLAAFSGVLAAPATGQTVTLLQNTSIRGLSADGRVVVGGTTGSEFIWTPSQGFTRLSDLGVDSNFGVFGVSGNGQVLIGSYGGVFASRWSQAAGLQNIQRVPGYNEWQQAISGSNDGSIAVGSVTKRVGNNFYVSQSVRWGPDGTYSFIGSYNTLGTNRARAISRDGSTIIGTAFDETAAYKWTDEGGVQILPGLPGTQGGGSSAVAVSGDGGIIVGLAHDRPVIWHDGTVTELHLSDSYSGFISPAAVSDDGTVVAGSVQLYTGNTSILVAGVWTPSTQFIPLTDYLASFGVQVPEGVRLMDVTAISADGRTFVGNTYFNNVDFVVTIPAPAGLPVLLSSVFLASRRRRGSAAPNIPRHRMLP